MVASSSPAAELYADSYERAAECARMVLPLLARHQLPANPVNFAVFYDIEQSRIRRTDTGELIGTVTVSLGVAQYRHGDAVEDLTRRCDEALYKAKRAGRNRVVVDV